MSTDRPEASRATSPVASLLNPRSVLMVGASGNATFLAGVVAANLRRFGYAGDLAGVNPKYSTVGGFACYPSVADVPDAGQYEIAYVAVRKEAVVEAVAACGQRGIRAAVIISAGFAESGQAAGRALQEELESAAREYGMAICGPNCAGIANFNANFVGYGTNNFLQLEEIVKGGVAVVTASGGLGNTIFSYLQAHLIGCSHLVSIGNEAVTSAAEYLAQLVEDPMVTMVVAYLESIRNPELFAASVERAHALGKPVILLKPGKTDVGRDAMRTHTAAVSGTRASYEGWCRKHGIILVDDIDQLVDTAIALSRVKASGGNQVGLFSLPGGGLALVADHADDNGFALPPLSPPTVRALEPMMSPLAVIKNPLDPSAGFRDSPLMGDVLVTMAADEGLDLVVYFPLVSDARIADEIVTRVLAAVPRMTKPLVCIWTVGSTPELEDGAWRRLREADVALYTRTSDCFVALRRQREYLRFLDRRRLRRAGPPDAAPAAEAPALTSRDPDEIRQELTGFLAAQGVLVPGSALVRSAEEAAAVVARMAGPAALKVVSADIPHKSEAGGVRLGVTGAEEARAAFAGIMDNAAGYAPHAVIDGVEVQEMVPRGMEVLVGITTEPDLGPMVVAGAGGVLAELVRDRASWPAPITAAEARDLLAGLRIAPLLAGFRGAPPADTEALVLLVVAVSRFAAANVGLGLEIDINPVVVAAGSGGVAIVDCLVEVRPADAALVRDGSR